jgi:hypothetical protein
MPPNACCFLLARPLQVITLSDDQVVRVWDLRNHKCVQAIARNGEQAHSSGCLAAAVLLAFPRQGSAAC